MRIAVNDQCDYTLLHMSDLHGRTWIVEALSPITDRQEICFTLNLNGKAVRAIYGYSEETQAQHLYRASVEVVAEGRNPFKRDNYVVYFDPKSKTSSTVSQVKMRLNQRINQEIVDAQEQRLRSKDFGHNTELDGERAIQIMVDNSLKLVLSDNYDKITAHAPYIEAMSCITETSEHAYFAPLSEDIELIMDTCTAETGQGEVIIGGKNGIYEVSQAGKLLSTIDTNSLSNHRILQKIPEGVTDIERFSRWAHKELGTVSYVADNIFKLE